MNRQPARGKGRTDRRVRRTLAVVIAVAVTLAALLPTVPARAQVVPQRPELISPKAEESIRKALAFLARSQARDGSWRGNAYHGAYPTAMTALAGLALMAGGNTPVEGEYAPNVRKAVEYLLSCANRTGLISRMNEEQRPMYGHGFAMLFLAEAYGMEQDRMRQQRIRKVLESAVELTGRSQSDWGGWLYHPDNNGDEGSVTVTQIQALRAVRNAGIKVPKDVIDKSILYIEKSANDDGGIRYTARGGGSSRPPITAAAVAVLYNAGEYEHPVAERCLKYLKNRMAGHGTSRGAFSGHEFYSMLYVSQAMYLSSEENWKDYFPAQRDYLVRTQASNGSWNGDGVGTTYGTAIALLTMQLPYKYLPILQR